MKERPSSMPLAVLRIARRGGPRAVRAREIIFEKHERLVYKIVNNLHLPSRLVEDAEQEGFVGLFEAVENFDLNRSTPFAAFASKYVYGAILRRVVTEASRHEQELSGFDRFRARTPDEYSVTQDDSTSTTQVVNDFASDIDRRVDVESFLGRLNVRDCQLLRGLYWDEKSQAEMAREARVGRSAINWRVQQISDKAREALAAHAA